MTLDWGFDLLLEHTDDGFRASVAQSPAGEVWAPFVLPFKPREQHAAIQQLLADPGENATQRADQFMLARQLGGKLFDAVFQGPLLECWQTSWRKAYAERATLHLRLRLGDVVELRTLPWEYLYDSTRDEFISAVGAHAVDALPRASPPDGAVWPGAAAACTSRHGRA